MFVLFYSILSTPFIIFDTFAFEKDGALFTFYQVALFLPGVGVTIRRIHDVGKSGWFALIPFYNFVLMCTDGTKGPNRFGPDPKTSDSPNDSNQLPSSPNTQPSLRNN
jgi:uncharacterized membrane protein YhaH (DUF805 family)